MKNNMHLCRMLIVALLACGAVPAFGQAAVTFPSPESSALINQITTSVDLYTGTAPMNIPLYTISSRGFQIPISLNYQGSGIRVEDVATRVGQGWRLSAGGRITRVIRGIIDEEGYILRDSLALADSIRQGVADSSLVADVGNIKDGEPDLFYFEIPGRAGMFVFDTLGVAYGIPYQSINVEVSRDSLPTSGSPLTFVLTDENGIQYHFTSQEHGGPHREITAWLLDEITDLRRGGMQIAQFFYTKNSLGYSYTNYNASMTYEVTYGGTSTVIDSKSLNSTSTIEEMTLESIQWDNGRVVFVPGGLRQDLSTPTLGEIQIYSSSQLLKSFAFDYSTFHNKAPQLLRVSQLDRKDAQRETLYFFTYHEQFLPDRDSWATDHWGYYNGDDNAPSMFPAHSIGSYSYVGANKEPLMPYTAANMLTGITYKNGGRKEFVYEANRIRTPGGSEKTWAGLRIKQIKEYDGLSTSPSITQYKYEREDGTCSGEAYDSIINYQYSLIYAVVHPTPNPNTPWYRYTLFQKSLNSLSDISGSLLVYSRVKEILPNQAYNTYQYSSFHSDNDDAPNMFGGSSYDTNAGDVPRTSKHWKRGLLTAKKSYSAEHELLLSETYTYRKDAPAKRVVPAYVFRNLGGASTLCTYDWVSQPLYLEEVRTEGPATLTSTVTYAYDTIHLGVREMHLYDAEENHFLTYTTYPYDYAFSGTPAEHSPAEALKSLLEKRIIAPPIEKVRYKNGKVLGADLFLYRDYGAGRGILLDQHKTLLLQNPLEEGGPTGFTRSSASGTEFLSDSRYSIETTYPGYDSYDNPTYVLPRSGQKTAYLYGYKREFPIAVIQNAKGEQPDAERSTEVFHTSFENEGEGETVDEGVAKTGQKVHKGAYQLDLTNFLPGNYRVSYWQSIDQGQSWTLVPARTITVAAGTASESIGGANAWIDEVRVMPADATMTTYTYQPGVGLSTKMDTNGQVVYYEYDDFGRLKAVRDNERRLVESYEYK